MPAAPEPTTAIPRLRGVWLRLFRAGLLVLAVLALREKPAPPAPLRMDQVRDVFANATSLDDQGDPQAVRDAEKKIIGFVTQTLPVTRDIIGYSGPTNLLIALDTGGRIVAVRVLHSDDTPDHVSEVVAQRSFFKQFIDRSAPPAKPLDGVTGATLTSSAITESVWRKLGSKMGSLRFPEPITIDEVKAMEPKAASLRATSDAEVFDVFDDQGTVIARVLRTSPSADKIVGYKGPTDSLVLLDAAGRIVRGVRLRKSYDTQRYVGYVTGDDYFLKLFAGMSTDKLAAIDFKTAKPAIEGVSGATETSWGIAESLRMRMRSYTGLADQSTEPSLALHWRWQDSGHLLVLLSAFAMAFTRLRGIGWLRIVHHVVLVVYVGLMAGELLSQAMLTGWARHGTPWRTAPGLVLIAVVTLLAPVITRRQLYCHHICPHGALQQLLMKRARWQWSLPKWLEGLPFVLLGGVLLLTSLGVGFNLNSIEPFDAYVWKVAGLASLLIALVGLVLSLFVPMAYCRVGCPTGALFKLLRYSGAEDSLGKRDLIALVVVLAAFLLRFLHA